MTRRGRGGRAAAWGSTTIIAVALLAGAGCKGRKEAEAKLNFAERWAELDKRDTGPFWSCVVAGDIEVASLVSLDQVQMRVESAYATQPKTFVEHVTTDCVPKIQHAESATSRLANPPAEFEAATKAYVTSLQHMRTGIEAYTDNLKNRQGTKDLDQLIQEYGNAWHSEPKPTPETVAYEKFLNCSFPGLQGMKDVKALLEAMADLCFGKQKDPADFMDHVTKDCGKLLQQIDAKATPSKTYKVTQKKFYEEDARHMRAWADCGRRARKGRKANDLGEFLVAVGEYMEARKEFGKKAKEIGESLK
jgi:hypothetical protein